MPINSEQIIELVDEIPDVSPNNCRALCRICLNASDISYKLSGIHEPDSGLSIIDMLRFCFSLHVSIIVETASRQMYSIFSLRFQSLSDDNFPQHICALCLNQLENVYSFHVKIHHSDYTLQMNGVQRDICLPDTVDDQSNTLFVSRIEHDYAIKLDKSNGKLLVDDFPKTEPPTEPMVMDEDFRKTKPLPQSVGSDRPPLGAIVEVSSMYRAGQSGGNSDVFVARKLKRPVKPLNVNLKLGQTTVTLKCKLIF